MRPWLRPAARSNSRAPRVRPVKVVGSCRAAYPRWRFFPSSTKPPSWVYPLVGVFAATRPEIDSTVTHAKRMESNDVLQAIAPALAALGYAIEQGKTKAGKLPRPVFFGDEGTFLRTYEIDSFQSETVLRWRSSTTSDAARHGS